MPEATPQSVPANAAQQQLAVWKHMEAEGFAQQDIDYVLAQFGVRKVNRILASGSEYADPFAWQVALDRAQAEERTQQERLVSEHGYPDTSGLEWREAHQARLQFLMSKYPDADWDLLLRGQFEGRDRKPSPRKARPVTVQVIEQARTRLISLTQQREELKAYGDSPAAVKSLDGSLRRVRQSLGGYGIDADALLEEHRERWSLIPFEAGQKERLKKHVAGLEELVTEMEALNTSGDTESDLLTATRRVLSVYREVLAGLGGDLPAGAKKDSGGVAPATAPDSGNSTTLPVGLPESAPQETPATTPASSLEPSSSAGETDIRDEKTEALLTAQQAAKLLGVGYTTMLDELRSGRFPFAHRVGTKWRISRKGLDAWLEGHRSDVETLRKQEPAVVPKPRGKKAVKPTFIRPDGKPLSF